MMMKGEYIDLVAHVYMEGPNGNQNHCVGTSRDLSVILIIRAGKIDLMMMMMMMMMVMMMMMMMSRSRRRRRRRIMVMSSCSG